MFTNSSDLLIYRWGRWKRGLVLAGGLWSAGVLVGCGDDSPGDGVGVCVPGETQGCLCSSALEGVQVCVDGGAAWGECRCEDDGAPNNDDLNNEVNNDDIRVCEPAVEDHCVEVCQDCDHEGDQSSDSPFDQDPNFESVREVGGSDPSRKPYGAVVGEYRGVKAYSNYVSCEPAPECWYGVDNGRSIGTYGFHFQCVEYVVRFYAEALGYDSLNGNGSAKYYWLDPALPAGRTLERYPNGSSTPPQPGDIIVFDSPGVGHVAIVRAVSEDHIQIIQQNYFHNDADGNHRINMSQTGGGYRVNPLASNGAYPVLGWLRVPNSTLECVLDSQCDDEESCDAGICITGQPCDPQVTSISPGSLCPGETSQMTIRGTCLKEDPVQGVRVHMDDIELTNRLVISDSEVSVLARVLDGASPGPRAVTYANSDSRRGTAPGLFEVSDDCAPAMCEGPSSQACGSCNSGTRTRSCNDGVWSDWSTCSGESGCQPGSSEACGEGGTRNCNDRCQWGICDVPMSVSVTSVSPTRVELGRETIFTVRGTELPSTLAFFIDQCADLVSLDGDSTQRQFQCTPRFEVGRKAGVVKDRPNGTTLFTFEVDVHCNGVNVHSVLPLSASLNQSTTFTVIGCNLPNSLAFFIEQCADLVDIDGDDTTHHRFQCTPRFEVGRKAGVVKDRPNGTTLHTFTVDVR